MSATGLEAETTFLNGDINCVRSLKRSKINIFLQH